MGELLMGENRRYRLITRKSIATLSIHDPLFLMDLEFMLCHGIP